MIYDISQLLRFYIIDSGSLWNITMHLTPEVDRVCVCVCVREREREREREIAFSIDAILRFLIVFFMFFKCFDVKDE
jgi:hypothetical protein